MRHLLVCAVTAILVSASLAQEPLSWFYTAEQMNSERQVVEDSQADTGRARFASAPDQAVSQAIVFGPYTAEQPAGRYRATFRLKVADNSSAQPVCRLDTTALSNAGYILAELVLKGTDFATPNEYQEFALEYERPDAFISEFRVIGLGHTDLWVDGVRCKRLEARPDAAWAAQLSVEPPPGLAFRPHSPPRVLLIRPERGARLRLAQAAAEAGAEAEVVGFDGWPGEKELPDNFLATYEAVYVYDVICLGSLYAGALGIERRQRLYDFVHAGGGLLLFGGPRAFAQGGWMDTRLAELCPLELLPRADSLFLTGRDLRVLPAADDPLLRGLRFDDPVPLVWMLHEVAGVKSGTRVLLEAGEPPLPLLALWHVGRGRVAALTLNPRECLDPHREVNLWDWPGWQTLSRRLLEWLARPDGM